MFSWDGSGWDCARAIKENAGGDIDQDVLSVPVFIYVKNKQQ